MESIFASDFINFCRSDMIIWYMYELLVKEKDLLTSAGQELPPCARQSSEKPLRVSDMPPRKEQRASTATSSPGAISKLVDAVSQPQRVILMHEGDDASSSNQKRKAMQEEGLRLAKMNTKKAALDILMELSREARAVKAATGDVPEWMQELLEEAKQSYKATSNISHQPKNPSANPSSVGSHVSAGRACQSCSNEPSTITTAEMLAGRPLQSDQWNEPDFSTLYQ